jgi:hypothetical protein
MHGRSSRLNNTKSPSQLPVRSFDAEPVARSKGGEHIGAHRAQEIQNHGREDIQRKLSFHPGAGGRAVIPLP